jgi:voltage-gated potassium channel
MLIQTRIAARTAPLMFSLAVAFLVCQAVLIVIWVDVPSLREKTLGQETETGEIEMLQQSLQGPVSPTQVLLERTAVGLMMFIWPVVLIEAVYHWMIRAKTRALVPYHFYSLLFCICPSLRMCARSVEMHGRLWLPGLGWQRADRRLRRRLEQRFSVPMIGIALLILPVLIVEFLLKEQVARYVWLRVSLHIGTGVIWFAFAAEFILMVSIAEKKLDYIRRNWVDLAIIALPFFSFLRSMQAMRGTRLAKLAKLPQLTKLARAYRLRGTVLKAFRALVLLDVSARLFRKTPEQQLQQLRAELVVTQREARLIRLMIARLERELATAGDVPDATSAETLDATESQAADETTN